MPHAVPFRYASPVVFVFVMLFLALFLSATGCTTPRGKGGTDGMAPGGVSVSKGSRGTKPYTVRGKTYYPLLSSHGFREEGIASWYGKDFHGKKTANGESYDMYGMTAAHKLLPFNTKVRVTNKENGKSIVVRINDRGPFVSNRVIDLTRTGAEKIGMIAKGTAPVILETTGSTPFIKDGDMQGRFYVQVGAFANQSNAERLVAKLKSQGSPARAYFADQVAFWRVQAGPYSSLTKAENAADALQQEFPSNFVVAE